MRPIVNAARAAGEAEGSGEFFACSMTPLAEPLGAHAIGANLTRVPPGKAAFPFHHHYANEEHFFIVSGSGLLRIGDEVYAVEAMDYIVNLPGGPERAHQLINSGEQDLVYLAISTREVPEVVGYPDSAKTGIRPASLSGESERFLVVDADRNRVGYWHGESGAKVAELLASPRSS